MFRRNENDLDAGKVPDTIMKTEHLREDGTEQNIHMLC